MPDGAIITAAIDKLTEMDSPPVGGTIMYGLKIPKEVRQALEELASEQGMTLSAIGRAALREYLAGHMPAAE